MGQKVHPYGLRLGIVTDWKSRWYSEKDYARQVNQDHEIRQYLRRELTRGAVSRIDIERIGSSKVQIDVHTARPGVVIGRGGSEAERLRTGLEKLTNSIVKFNVIEVQNAEIDATLLARSVADQLEGRVAFRRAMKRVVSTALKAGAEGVRVQAKGRLGGADMGRREWYLEGRVPLHTLRADIDYGQATAATTVGAIGVQVWVYKGDVLPSAAGTREKIAAEARLAAGGPAERRRSAKSRAEAAAGTSTGPRLIEAGGGKRAVEPAGGKARPGGRRLIEAGGGRRLAPGDARAAFDDARDEVQVREGAAQDAAATTPPVSGEVETPADAVTETTTTATDVVEAPAGEAMTEAAPAEETAAEAPAADDAAAGEAVAEEAASDEAAADEASSDEAAAGETAAEADEPVADDAVAEEPVAEAEEPVAEAAVADEPVAEGPVAEAVVDEAESAAEDHVEGEESAGEAVDTVDEAATDEAGAEEETS